jgi:hypothetical protein
LQTAILTNATDTIPFQHVLDSMHAAASTVFFTDDTGETRRCRDTRDGDVLNR